MNYPNLSHEKNLWKKGYKRIASLDEAGRGPLAGPVTAAVVVIKRYSENDFKNISLRDSKKLSPRKRQEFYSIITKNPAIEWAVVSVSEKTIDRINILQATKLAMEKAIQKLKKKPDFLIIDGNFEIKSNVPQRAIIKADERVLSCTMASIIAKVTRDRLMERYHKRFLNYGFNQHKGYLTKYHLKMLKKNGPCSIHRQSFRPIKGSLRKTIEKN